MGDPLLLVALILPDTQCRTAPQISKLVLLNTTNHLTDQGLCTRIRFCHRFFPVIEVQSHIGSDDDVMIMILIKRCDGFPFEQHFPSQGFKAALHWIKTAQVRRGADP